MDPAPASPANPTAAKKRYLHLARLLGLAVLSIGLCVLVGWTFHLLPLLTVLPGLVAMKPNAAVCLCLGGLSLFFWRTLPPARGATRFPACSPSAWRRSAQSPLLST